MFSVNINKSLLYLLIFTIVTSFVAYSLIVKGYDDVFNLGYYAVS